MSSKVSDINQNLAKAPVRQEEKSLRDSAYTEIPGLTDPALDVLNQLSMNMKMLTDLHQKLQFTIREIKSVIR